VSESRESRGAIDRRRQAFDVTCELVVENGAHGVTLSAVAERMGVSRQFLYTIYPDLDAIYHALYDEVRRRFLAEEGSSIDPPRTRPELLAFISERCDRYLMMPPACAIVSLAALHRGRSTTNLELSLRESIYANLTTTWVDPLVEAGYDRDEVVSVVIAFANVMFGLVIGANSGLTTREWARERLVETAQGLIAGISPAG
jgi:AcrR family transcriptional regulator